MSEIVEVRVPDLGDFENVEVIEVLVADGDAIEPDQPLVTLESDKATMDVPAPRAGRVRRLRLRAGDRVSTGSPILDLEVAPGAAEPAPEPAPAPAPEPVPAPAPQAGPSPGPAVAAPAAEAVDLVVLGAGPGGYTAAFRAADLGLRTVLVERYPTLGGVCLNVGCIPSKALLHTAGVMAEVEALAAHGVDYGAPRLDLDRLRAFKDGVVAQLTRGLAGLARQRGVEVVQGEGTFESAGRLRVRGRDGERAIAFRQAIIAAGSQAVHLPGLPEDPRVMDSTDALALATVPDRLLVIGGGIIGLEMACVYDALGSRVGVVELTEGLLPGVDRDIVRPLEKRIRRRYESIEVATRVAGVAARDDGLVVTLEGPDGRREERYDRVLVAVGRRPNGARIGAENAGVEVDPAGFIPVDRQQRTNVANLFAIGDITGQPMLAHKATHEGKVAAEVAAGRRSGFDAMAIPSVAYTDPEVAWTGVTEAEAARRGMKIRKATFPWAASGRALGMGRGEGLTKVIFDEESGRLVGAAVVGPHAGDLIAEATLALELGADASDLALTIHPHPTLSETLNFAAEMVEGTVTDLYLPPRSRGAKAG